MNICLLMQIPKWKWMRNRKGANHVTNTFAVGSAWEHGSSLISWKYLSQLIKLECLTITVIYQVCWAHRTNGQSIGFTNSFFLAHAVSSACSWHTFIFSEMLNLKSVYKMQLVQTSLCVVQWFLNTLFLIYLTNSKNFIDLL